MTLGAHKFEIKIDGSVLAADVFDRLMRAEFSESIDRLDVMRLVFDVPPEEPGPMTDAFKIGQKFTIELGDGSSTRTGYGDITEVAHDWTPESPWTMTITGLDRLHRLSDSSYTRMFQDMKHSDIISTIAGDHGLSSDAQGVQTSATVTLQAGESNAAFLKRLARLYNYYVRVEDNKLVFGRRNQADGEVTCSWIDHIEEFSLRTSSEGVVKEVTAVGWDAEAQAKVTSTKTAAAGIGGSLDAIGAIDAFGDKSLVLNATSATQATSADTIAEAELQRRAERFVQGNLLSVGLPAAKPMARLKIEDGPDALCGEFIVSQVTHVLEPGAGYKSRIEFFSDGI